MISKILAAAACLCFILTATGTFGFTLVGLAFLAAAHFID